PRQIRDSGLWHEGEYFSRVLQKIREVFQVERSIPQAEAPRHGGKKRRPKRDARIKHASSFPIHGTQFIVHACLRDFRGNLCVHLDAPFMEMLPGTSTLSGVSRSQIK